MALALCLTLLPATALAAEPHTHCVCGKAQHTNIGDHKENRETTFDKRLKNDANGSLCIADKNSIDGDTAQTDSGSDGWLLPEGAYYLESGVTIDRPIVIRSKVTICLNDKTLQSTANNKPVFQIIGGELTLTDCKSTGKVMHSSSSGGGVQVDSGTFNLYGGTIFKNTADYGGGVLVTQYTTFNMYGGSITDNAAAGDQGFGGGGVCVKGGTFNMHDGTIAANKATIYTGKGNGGGVSVVDGGRFTMNGGTIGGTSADRDYNQAKGNGGGVYVNGSTFEMKGSASVAYNKAIKGSSGDNGGNGGGVYVKENGKFIMHKTASVTGNTATNKGGGVYVSVSGQGSKFEMNDDASVTGNTTTGNQTGDNGDGGGVYVKSGTFDMNGNASVKNNETATKSWGGGVYVENGGTFNMNDGTISENTAFNGGGVYASGGSTFNMNGPASITKNIGNGVCVSNGVTFTVSGAPTVTGNTKEGAASNVYLNGIGTFITIGKTGLSDNASIGVTKVEGVDNGVIAKNVSTNYSGKFFSDDTPRHKVEYNETEKQLVLTRTAGTHTHIWSYETKDNDRSTIYVRCTGDGDCAHKNPPATVKISMTQSTYPYSENMKAPTAELTYSDNWPTDLAKAQESAITYWESGDGGNTYTNLADAPTNVGKYKASITVEGVTASVKYEITSETTPTILVTKITLDPTSAALKVGETKTLTATVTPSEATNKKVTWTSSEPDVATVDTNGTVTAHKAGTAEITATAKDDSKVSATCKVTVTDDTTTGGGTTPSQPGGSSSGGSGSYDSNPIIKTETKNNADGSTTKTETRKDGTVTATTTAKDGSVSKTETKKDGSSVTENKAADGSTGTVKTDKHGQTEAKTALSNKAVEDAKRNGEAVKAPVEVEATRDSSTAPTVKIELPGNSGETEVEIPVTNVKPGTVAVLVHPDGTEEIVKNSLPTEDGIQLTVNGGATVKIVNNSKDFIDTQDHWAKDEIDFVSARELVNGISATRYAPDASATRAQLWTILARQNDANLTGGNTWYEKAQLWSKDKGISDGTQPDATITRAQMVTMLWRASGSPAAQSGTAFQDVEAGSYYAQAVAWAVENGITAGVGGGRFDPNSTCTRAQIATFLARSMK